jgi:hypothetical protein
LEATLKARGLPVKLMASAAVNEVVTEAMVSAPAVNSKSLRVTVDEMVDEACESLTREESDYLDEIIEIAMSGAGL